MKRILPTIADVALPAILIAAEFRRARIPRGRMNDGAIHAAFVHEGDGLLRGKVSYRPVRRIAWQAGGPEMDLRIDDLHDIEFPADAPAPVCSAVWGPLPRTGWPHSS